MKLSDLPARLEPYFQTLLFGQVVLLGLVILVGCILLIRRKMSGRALVDEVPDKKQLASEINEEILRLRGLRDRLSPEFRDPLVTAAPVAAGEPAVVPAKSDTASVVEIQAAEARGESRGVEKAAKEIAELKAKLAALESVPQPGAGADSGSAQELAKLKDELTKALGESGPLKEKVGALEKVLSEYQIFEEDFALVKKYKEENERLKQQLDATKGAAPASPALTQEDIESLFSDLGSSADDPASAQAAPAPTPAPAPAPAAAPAPAPVAESTPAPAVEAAPATEAPTPAEPVQLTEEAAEALAETANDDEFMKEFEKLLEDTAPKAGSPKT